MISSLFYSLLLNVSFGITQSSGLPPSAFQVPYTSFREVSSSSVSVHSHDSNSSTDELEDVDQPEEGNSRDLDYDFTCFFLSSQRLDLYRSIDFRCEDMLSGKHFQCCNVMRLLNFLSSYSFIYKILLVGISHFLLTPHNVNQARENFMHPSYRSRIEQSR